MITRVTTAHCDHKEPTFQGSHYAQCPAKLEIPETTQPYLAIQDQGWATGVTDHGVTTYCPDHTADAEAEE